MATLYKPKVVSYRLPSGKYRTEGGRRVTRDTPGAVRIESRSPTWWGRYTDGAGVEHQVRLSRSKETARRMLAKLAGDAQLASVGITDPFAEHRARPLTGHAEDFARHLAAKGDTAKYVRKVRTRCLAVLEGLQAEALADLQPSAVLEFLADLRARGRPRAELPKGQELFTKAELVEVLGVYPSSVWAVVAREGLEAVGNGRARRYPRATVEALQDRFCRGAGVRTSNHYLAAVKGFTRWLVKDRRAAYDPLACLSSQNADADLRVVRRALEPADFAALLEAARAGKTYRGLAGPDRAALYTLAAHTGFRASELASLTPASFDFTAPSVTVEAAFSKHRRKDVQPLRPDVAAILREYVRGRPAQAPLWPGAWTDDGALMLRHDLGRAGIPFLDGQGRSYDFHALRHQFISDLVAAGVHPKDAQVLARHSTITLTMNRYAHVRPANLHAALDKLPALPTATPAEDQARPTEKPRGRRA
jgi:integrase